jgi:hypothetical protein
MSIDFLHIYLCAYFQVAKTITADLISGERVCLNNIVEQLAVVHYAIFSLQWCDLVNQNFLVAEKAVGALTAHYNEVGLISLRKLLLIFRL